MSTTLTISEALKGELESVRDELELASLNETVLHLMRNPRVGSRQVEGHDKTLTEPIKVSTFTQKVVQRARDGNVQFRDYEDVLRDRAGVVRRDTGEEPIEVRPLS